MNRFSYDIMKKMNSLELLGTLKDLKSSIEKRMDKSLSNLRLPQDLKANGVIDHRFGAEQKLRSAYFQECELIIEELNKQGHNLLPLDIDSDIDFQRTSISWATDWQDAKPKGLDIEFLPNKVMVNWVVSADA